MQFLKEKINQFLINYKKLLPPNKESSKNRTSYRKIKKKQTELQLLMIDFEFYKESIDKITFIQNKKITKLLSEAEE